MSEDNKSKEQTLRFSNSRKTEMFFGVEPYGIYYDVEPGKVIEVVFTPYNDYKHTIVVEEDGRIVLDLIGDYTIYLDGLEIYTS